MMKKEVDLNRKKMAERGSLGQFKEKMVYELLRGDWGFP
jgi:hypothetical protein